MPDYPEKTVSLALGPATLTLTPLPPELWRQAQERSHGPAGFCLALLESNPMGWQGVAAGEDQSPAPVPENLARLPAACAGLLIGALCQPWLSAEEQNELDALERHLGFVADYPGVSCTACREQEQAGEDPPDCRGCPPPPLPATCQEALRLYGSLRHAPPGAAEALLPPILGELSPRQARLLLARLSLVHRMLGPPPARPLALT